MRNIAEKGEEETWHIEGSRDEQQSVAVITPGGRGTRRGCGVTGASESCNMEDGLPVGSCGHRGVKSLPEL